MRAEPGSRDPMDGPVPRCRVLLLSADGDKIMAKTNRTLQASQLLALKNLVASEGLDAVIKFGANSSYASFRENPERYIGLIIRRCMQEDADTKRTSSTIDPILYILKNYKKVEDRVRPAPIEVDTVSSANMADSLATLRTGYPAQRNGLHLLVSGWPDAYTLQRGGQHVLVANRELARWLEYSRPCKLTALARRHWSSLQCFGIVPTVGTDGVPVVATVNCSTELYYSRDQVLYLIAKSETANANALTVQFVQAYRALVDSLLLASYEPKAAPPVLEDTKAVVSSTKEAPTAEAVPSLDFKALADAVAKGVASALEEYLSTSC